MNECIYCANPPGEHGSGIDSHRFTPQMSLCPDGDCVRDAGHDGSCVNIAGYVLDQQPDE